MEKHLELSDTEFEKLFAICSINPALFSHEAHLRLAWIHVTKYGVKIACENLCAQILIFVEGLGQLEKFNRTLTIAAVKAVHHFVQKSKSDNFNDFIKEFPHLKNSFKELLGLHYSIDIFNSEKAKKEYIAPDLMPFG